MVFIMFSLLIVPLIIMLFLLKHILFADAAIAGLIVSVVSWEHMHPVISIMCGIAVVIAMLVLSRFLVTFFIIAGSSIVFFILLALHVMNSYTDLDMIWRVVICVVTAAIVLLLHVAARNRLFGDDIKGD